MGPSRPFRRESSCPKRDSRLLGDLGQVLREEPKWDLDAEGKRIALRGGRRFRQPSLLDDLLEDRRGLNGLGWVKVQAQPCVRSLMSQRREDVNQVLRR